MRQIEEYAHWLQRDEALLLDRRAHDIDQVFDAKGIQMARVIDVESQTLGLKVHAFALKFPDLAPPILQIGSTRYRRLMDQFYLPTMPDPILSTALFDFAASIYDDIIDRNLNVAVSKRLLELIVPEGIREAKILDFGCGTGLALLAINQFPSKGLSLVGIDNSAEMLELARSRGEKVLTPSSWTLIPTSTWDGAISTFVLHYGVSNAELALIADQLKPKHYFAANFFKADDIAVSELCNRLLKHRLGLTRIDRTFCNEKSRNPILVFEKLS